MLKKQAYSLMEIISVIAIIGILSVVVVPAYTSYRNKAHVSSAVGYAMGMAKALMLEYARNDAWPSSIEYQEITFNTDVPIWVGQSSVGGINYTPHWHHTTKAGIIFSVTGLTGVTEYTEPASGNILSDGSSIELLVDTDYVQYCGVAPDDDRHLPVAEVIPPCNCSASAQNAIGSECRVGS